jgi:hypothetical protein
MTYNVAKKYFLNHPSVFRIEFVKLVDMFDITTGSDVICK